MTTKFLKLWSVLFLMVLIFSCSDREFAPNIKKQKCPGGFCDEKLPCDIYINDIGDANNMICTHSQCIILCNSEYSENFEYCPKETKHCATYEQYSYCSDADGLPIEICEE